MTGIGAVVVVAVIVGAAIWRYQFLANNPCIASPSAVVFAPPFQKNEGFAYVAPMPGLQDKSDSSDAPARSPIILCEGDRLLGPSHSVHDDIRTLGNGRYSHWTNYLLFSTSDNSDPNINNRKYTTHIFNATQ